MKYSLFNNFLILFFILSIISCGKNKDKINTNSRSLEIKISNEGIQKSYDGKSWILESSIKKYNGVIF